MDWVLEFRDVEKTMGGHPVLRGATFAVGKGEFVFLTGPTGSGKTTTLRLSYADILPDQGSVFVLGRETGSLRPKEVRELRAKLGLVFQDPRLLSDRNVLLNVSFGLEILGYPARRAREMAKALLGEMGLGSKADAMPDQLSGGEKQAVAIARALVREPVLLLADEPTGNLDGEAAEGVMELLRYANDIKGTTVLLATHSKSLISSVPGARILALVDGKMVEVTK